MKNANKKLVAPKRTKKDVAAEQVLDELIRRDVGANRGQRRDVLAKKKEKAAQKDIKVKVTVYKNYLCIETINPDIKDNSFYPLTPGKIGCVLVNTTGKLGVSPQAVEWLQQIDTVGDDIGDVDSWMSYDRKTNKQCNGCFSWIGDIFSVKDKTAVGSRTHNIRGIPFVSIPNTTSEKMKEMVNGKL